MFVFSFIVLFLFFFFFNDTATTEIYTSLHTLSLHDALPIWRTRRPGPGARPRSPRWRSSWSRSSRSEEHTSELQSRNDISYAVFCLKKKKKQNRDTISTQQYKKTTT